MVDRSDRVDLSILRRLTMDDEWLEVLAPQMERPYFVELQRFVDDERTRHVVYPQPDDVFAALRLTPPRSTQVVIVGQDPYHGPGQAHGLSFSVPRGVDIPPSLRNILRELHYDVGVSRPTHGNLESWAHQGVLLLNATLTVRAGAAGSHHGRGWENFTDAILSHLGSTPRPLVFVLWGSSAKSKAHLIASHHTIVTSAHPSPLSAHRGFFGSRPFSQIDRHLERHRLAAIDWRLPE